MKVYGKNVFNELKTDLKSIRRVYVSKNSLTDEIKTLLENNNIRYEIVDNRILDKQVDGNHQGIVVDIHDYEYYKLEDILNESTIVVLDHLEDPHNFGAIIRTCEAAGVKGIIIPKDRSVSVNSTVMKTSAGALSYVKIVMVNNIVQMLEKLKQDNYFVYGTDMDGVDYKQVDYAQKKVIIIGSEGKGISRLVKETCDEIISIPMKGNINSLNASVAAAIVIFNLN